MKKILISLFLLLSLVFTLASCNPPADQPEDPTNTQETNPADTSETESGTTAGGFEFATEDTNDRWQNLKPMG